jgi:hypothetical protein
VREAIYEYLGLSVLMFAECDSVEILIKCLILFSLLRKFQCTYINSTETYLLFIVVFWDRYSTPQFNSHSAYNMNPSRIVAFYVLLSLH